MNKKEIVKKAIKFELDGVIPCDFEGDSIVKEKLKKEFNVHTHRELIDKIGSYIIDIRGVIDPIWVGPYEKVREYGNESYINHLGFIQKEVETEFGKVKEHSDYLFKNANTINDLKDSDIFIWPSVDMFDFTGFSSRLDEYSDLAIMASGVSIYQHCTLVRGLENFLCDLLLETDVGLFIIDKFVEFYLAYYEKMLKEANGKIDILRIADDLGMQDRLLISPDLFKKYIIPNVKKFADLAHKYNASLMFHSCGDIFEFIPELIDCGVDILDPIQTTAKGMEIDKLIKAFAGKICFHGSIDTQYLLPNGTPEEVYSQTLNNLNAFATTKGFIVSPSHVLQPDVPIDNIIALYNCVRDYNKY